MVYLFIIIDLVFCGLCLYITALYKELQQMLRCTDVKSDDLEFHDGKVQYIRRGLRDGIEFHLAIIK